MYVSRIMATFAAGILLSTTLVPALANSAHQPAGFSSQSVIFAGLRNGTLYRSTDHGLSWQEADSGLPYSTAVNVVAVAGSSTSLIYAATDGSGVYASYDGGRSWSDDNSNGGPDGQSVVGLVVSPSDPQQVYAISQDGTGYQSGDGGRDWYSIPLIAPSSSSFTTLALDPLRPSTLFAGSIDGIYVSTDGGSSWSQASGMADSTTVKSIAFSDANADVAFAATDSGIYQTIDGGSTWQLENQSSQDGLANFQSIAVDPRASAHIVAATTYGQLYRSLDGGTSWQITFPGPGAQINALLYDPAVPGTILAATNDGSALSTSTDGGADWQGSDPGFGADNAVLCLAAAGHPALPTDPVNPPSYPIPGAHYFAQSHHIVRGAFLNFYNHYGSLKIFGLPLTEAFSEGGQLVQYFERARLVATGARVAITPLGVLMAGGRYFPQAHTHQAKKTEGRLLWHHRGLDVLSERKEPSDEDDSRSGGAVADVVHDDRRRDCPAVGVCGAVFEGDGVGVCASVGVRVVGEPDRRVVGVGSGGSAGGGEHQSARA